jgi:hypothetical protein
MYKEVRLKVSYYDARGLLYYSKERAAATDYRFPYQNDSFDVVFLMSVFTHMFYNEVEHYISEINRGLEERRKAAGIIFLNECRNCQSS